ncbi:MAG: carboxypeptidase-like regulatory domain-containing protein [Cyclobacteriaceae bacterium]|jgi:hypothetical protein|nr:carboxypeptidase-like regulatory domain-containing protein [Flammeovirgaceae bacterium]
MMRSIAVFVAILVVLLFSGGGVQAQQKRRIIQLSGFILEANSDRGVPGAHVYVPLAGRGVPTNAVGFFSLPVLVGDSVVISAVGYVKRHFIVPENAPEYETIVVEMAEDITYLKEVIVTQFPTEEVFKQAVLAMNIPLDDTNLDKRNLNAELLALMARTTPIDGATNYRYYMDEQVNSYGERFQPRVNPFLNPFNWARFVRDLKNNKKK